MKNVTRKIISFFFVLLWFIPLLLVLSFNIKQHLIRYKMNQKMEHQQFQKIIIPETQVIWMDDDEIWYNNLMFDVHSSTLENGMYTFEGFFDDEETNLVKQRNKTTEKSHEQNGEEHTLISQLFKWLDSPYNSHESRIDLLNSEARKYRFYQISSLICLPQKVPTPPPRRALIPLLT